MASARTSRSHLPPLTLKTKFWFEIDGRFVIGEGGIDLLRAIELSGSLAGGAEAVGWSYRHAWGYLRRAEQALGVPLTRPRPGKGTRRGLNLTVAGTELVRRATSKQRG